MHSISSISTTTNVGRYKQKRTLTNNRTGKRHDRAITGPWHEIRPNKHRVVKTKQDLCEPSQKMTFFNLHFSARQECLSFKLVLMTDLNCLKMCREDSSCKLDPDHGTNET